MTRMACSSMSRHVLLLELALALCALHVASAVAAESDVALDATNRPGGPRSDAPQGRYSRYRLVLVGGAEGDGDLTVRLHTRDGRPSTGWATTPTTSGTVRAHRLVRQEAKLVGPIVVELGSVLYEYQLDTVLDRGEIAGTFAGKHGIVDATGPITGPLSGQLQPRATAGSPFQLHLELASMYTAGQVRSPIIDATVRDGKITDGKFYSANKGDRGFRGKLEGGQLTLGGGRLRGTIRATVTAGEATRGTYEFAIDGRADFNFVNGTFRAKLGDSDRGAHAFSGRIRGMGAPSATDGVLTATLGKALPGDRPLTLLLDVRDGRVRAGIGRGGNAETHKVDPSRLTLRGQRLGGPVKVAIKPAGGFPPGNRSVECTYAVGGFLKDGRLTGSYSGRYGRKHEAVGVIRGRILSEEDLETQANVPVARLAVGDTASGKFDPTQPGKVVSRAEARRIGWPSWAGPYYSFRGIACGYKLVDDLHNAKLLWQSEETTPVAKAFASVSDSYSGGRHGRTQKGQYPGGGASPVVMDGRVLLSYYVPAKDSPWVIGEKARWRKRPLLATDVVLCVDADTGKTVWKREFPGGPFYIGHKSAGNSGLSPCVSDGKVYSFSTGHMLRALEVATGNVVWETPLPAKRDGQKNQHEQAMAYRAEILRRQGSGQEAYLGVEQMKSRHFGSRNGMNLACIDGAVLVEGVHAFDAATGRRLWNSPFEGHPVRWRHSGRDLMLLSRRQSETKADMVCVEPRTGKVVWTEPFGGLPQCTLLGIEGDSVVGRAPGAEFLNEKGKPSNDALLTMWRLGPRGAELLWRHDAKTGPRIHWKNQPVLAGDVAFCGISGEDGYPVACFDAKTGKHLGTINAPSGRRPGNILRIEDRALILGDASHIKNEVWWAAADGRSFRVIGKPWVNPHPPTTPLYATITWPYVDGRLYMRGADGIYCYDLRKQ